MFHAAPAGQTMPGWLFLQVKNEREKIMKAGARNKLTGKVTSITSDKVMSLVKFEIAVPAQMASVLTTESVQDLNLKIGDTVQLIVKAINVLPVKE